MTVDELLDLSDALLAEAKAMRWGAPSTKERWEAILQIEDASRRLHSAAGWLNAAEEVKP